MSSIERQLERVREKADLHRLIDELQDGDNVLVLAADSDLGSVKVRSFGDITIAGAVYLMESYKAWVFRE